VVELSAAGRKGAMAQGKRTVLEKYTKTTATLAGKQQHVKNVTLMSSNKSPTTY
jgi:hypothetical protein